MCFLFLLGTNRARGEGGSEGTPKDATPEAEGPASSAGGRHIQGRVGLTCVFSPDSYLTTPSSFPQPCLSLPCYRKTLGAPSPRGRAFHVLALKSQGQGRQM